MFHVCFSNCLSKFLIGNCHHKKDEPDHSLDLCEIKTNKIKIKDLSRELLFHDNEFIISINDPILFFCMCVSLLFFFMIHTLNPYCLSLYFFCSSLCVYVFSPTVCGFFVSKLKNWFCESF